MYSLHYDWSDWVDDNNNANASNTDDNTNNDITTNDNEANTADANAANNDANYDSNNTQSKAYLKASLNLKLIFIKYLFILLKSKPHKKYKVRPT